MLLYEFDKPVESEITQAQLDLLEKYLDKLFAAANLDVEFTRHFIDRVNDERNRKQITINELRQIFTKAYKRYAQGRGIAGYGPGFEAVLKDMMSDVNLPFVLKLDRKNKELDLIAKTIMRKKNFKSNPRTGGGKILPV